jgi:hypothetical protein
MGVNQEKAMDVEFKKDPTRKFSWILRTEKMRGFIAVIKD